MRGFQRPHSLFARLFVPVRFLIALLLCVALAACTPSSKEVAPHRVRVDTLSHYQNGNPKRVTVQQGDSMLEHRAYRHTGTLHQVVTADTTQTYFDLHDPDSAAVLKDLLQGRWQNLSADTSRDETSAFYIFEEDRLHFEDPSRVPLESLSVTYKNDQTLVTETGMSARIELLSFDTVRVTGYKLVRLPLPDSLRPPDTPLKTEIEP